MAMLATLWVVATLYFFFFFQAEDGIRDYKVTGVQTCALPIYPAAAAAGRFDQLLGTHFFDQVYGRGIDVYGAFPSLHVAYPLIAVWAAFRSEERRVGKECRSRWSPYH